MISRRARACFSFTFRSAKRVYGSPAQYSAGARYFSPGCRRRVLQNKTHQADDLAGPAQVPEVLVTKRLARALVEPLDPAVGAGPSRSGPPPEPSVHRL